MRGASSSPLEVLLRKLEADGLLVENTSGSFVDYEYEGDTVTVKAMKAVRADDSDSNSNGDGNIRESEVENSIPGCPCIRNLRTMIDTLFNLPARYPQLATVSDIGDSYLKTKRTPYSFMTKYSVLRHDCACVLNE